MVDTVTSMSRSGLRDWLVQRITAVIIGAYFLFILGYLVAHPGLQYADWHALFGGLAMRALSFLTFLSVVYHAWIGMWTIFTDYIKCPAARLTVTVLTVLALFGYLIWAAEILF